MNIRHFTFFCLFLLMAGEVYIAFDASTKGRDGLGNVIEVAGYLALSLFPLIAVLRSAYGKKRNSFFYIASWACILTGVFIQYAFHISHDASKVVVLAISLFVYWIFGTVALIIG